MLDVEPLTITLWSGLVIGGYHFLDYLFPRLPKRFGSLRSDRRRYVIKNLLKSVLLLILAVAGTPVMFRYFYHSTPDNMWIHTMGVLYAIPDVYALWWVRGMLYRSTVFHHVSVGLLATVGLFLDHNVETHWVAMLVYAYLSMWTGVVNFYLGVRFLLDRNDPFEEKTRRWIALFSLSVYVTCCIANWLYQLHTVMLWLDFRWPDLTWANFVGLLAYCAMLSFIVQDDLILIRKLIHECEPYREAAKQKELLEHLLRNGNDQLVWATDRILFFSPCADRPLDLSTLRSCNVILHVSAGQTLQFHVKAAEPEEPKE